MHLAGVKKTLKNLDSAPDLIRGCRNDDWGTFRHNPIRPHFGFMDALSEKLIRHHYCGLNPIKG